jgi:hypothetical protein
MTRCCFIDNVTLCKAADIVTSTPVDLKVVSPLDLGDTVLWWWLKNTKAKSCYGDSMRLGGWQEVLSYWFFMLKQELHFADLNIPSVFFISRY